jgi:dihydrofolate reductase
MRTLTYYVASSIDGFIAGPGGAVDFYPAEPDLLDWISATYPETLPTPVRQALGVDTPNRAFDTVVMGRGTYEPGPAAGFPSPYAHLKQYVFAHGVTAPDDVTVVDGDPVELIRKLKAEDGLGIYLAGGGNLRPVARRDRRVGGQAEPGPGGLGRAGAAARLRPATAHPGRRRAAAQRRGGPALPPHRVAGY